MAATVKCGSRCVLNVITKCNATRATRTFLQRQRYQFVTSIVRSHWIQCASQAPYTSSSRIENKLVQNDTMQDYKIVKSALNSSQGILHFEWNNGHSSSFAVIFLRDSCRCSHCYNSDSKQRQIDTCKQIPIDILPTSVNVLTDGIKLVWSDGHVSVFSHEFLWQRDNERFPTNTESFDISNTNKSLWDRKTLTEIPTFDFKDVLQCETERLEWFQSLCQTGVTLLTGAETKLGELDKLKMVFGGYFKSTHYGDTFQVASKNDPNSLAYTTQAILPHMDLPHYLYPPGIQVLHCIQQFSGQGAGNTFVDGFHVVNELKQNQTYFYELLTKYKVKYRDIGTDYYGEFETYFERPIIGVNDDGEVQSVDYSNWLRDYNMNGSAEEIQNFYKAYYAFTKLINAPENVLTYKLKEGDIVIFNNRRILHGRNGYEVDKMVSSGRLLEGCYFDWDPLYWSMRPVKRRLDKQKKITS